MPGPDGAVPDSHPIKVKVTSGIFHVPGGRFYERTTADRLYPSAESAEAAGTVRPSPERNQIATIQIATRRRTS